MRRGVCFRFGMRMAGWITLALCRTYRINIMNPHALDGVRSQNLVLSFWHGNMVIGWFIHRSLHMKALVSQSNDGEILAAILTTWGYTCIRGSSHRGGKEAMQMMIAEVKNGARLVVTPDGPTGPRHSMKIGAVRTAQQASVPLLIASIYAERKYLLKSWDRFEIPYPFSRVDVQYLGPITIDPSLDGDSLTQRVRQIEAEWLTIDQQWQQRREDH
jgi:Kdo2-lipid IVA 3' secondary acyltransferase